MDDLTATAEVLETEPPLTRQEMEKISELLSGYYAALDNILYHNRGVDKECLEIEELNARIEKLLA